MKTVRVDLGSRSYDILIGPGLLGQAVPILEGLDLGRRLFVVSNETVFPRYGQDLCRRLRQAGFETMEVLIPDGERHKNLETVGLIYTRLLEHRVDRGSAVVALGGGVTGDIAGFAAATILRGIPCIQIPTTLLAQVDSSVGGKTGVNHPLGKNLIGAFSQPRLVIVDTHTLQSLPPREFQSGLYEVVKYGLICDPDFFEFIETRLEEIQAQDPEVVGRMISRCCEIKAGIASRDEKEQGLRRILNFGHTFGHALEAATGYSTFTHGEAIGWGMEAETRLSVMRAGLEPASAERIVECIRRMGLRPAAEPVPVASLLEGMKLDKKRQGSRIVLVLLEQIGRAVIDGDIGREVMVEAWEKTCSGPRA